jgi:head-tail adaptor
MSFPGLLNSSCKIEQSVAGAADDMGGYAVPSWALIYRRVPCCYEALTRRTETLAYDKQVVQPEHYIYLEWRSGIKEGQRLTMDNGRIFLIKLIENTKEMDKFMKLSVVEWGKGEA